MRNHPHSIRSGLILATAGTLLLHLHAFAAQFQDVTTAADLKNTGAYCLSAAWGDYNNDGFPDLYIAVGGPGAGANLLYVNNGNGTFTRKLGADVGPIASATHASLGCAWVDFNNVGYQDLLVINGGWSNDRNDLYSNNRDGTFSARATGNLTSVGLVHSWAALADYDGDGWVDVYVPESASASGPFQHDLYHG